MRRPKLTRPTVELFSDGEILDVNMLHRQGAFTGHVVSISTDKNIS
jgi:hypothetical protein